MRNPSPRLLNRNSIALLVASFFCIIRGVTYAIYPLERDALPLGLEAITQIFGLYFWMLVWIGVGLYGVWSFLCRKNKKHYAWGAISGMLIAWGVMYGYGILLTDYTKALEIVRLRDFMRVVQYITLGALTALLSRSDIQASEQGVEKHD